MATLREKTDLIDVGEATFLEGLENSDNVLVRELIKLLASYTVDGVLQTDITGLAQLETVLINIVSETPYSRVANAYIRNFDDIIDINRQLQLSVNSTNISELVASNEQIVNFIENVTTKLKGTPTGVTTVIDKVLVGDPADRIFEDVVRRVPYRNTSLDQLIGPIADILREDIVTGVSFTSASRRIEQAMDANTIGLKGWSQQIARDALSQADGVINNEVRKAYNFEYLSYDGTIKDTTRPFCFHMLTEHTTVKIDELQSILNRFINRGLPIMTPTRSTPTGKPVARGKGMIPGTSVGNFMINRGGYNCRHAVLATKKP